jgi:hypothetical protein
VKLCVFLYHDTHSCIYAFMHLRLEVYVCVSHMHVFMYVSWKCMFHTYKCMHLCLRVLKCKYNACVSLYVCMYVSLGKKKMVNR